MDLFRAEPAVKRHTSSMLPLVKRARRDELLLEAAEQRKQIGALVCSVRRRVGLFLELCRSLSLGRGRVWVWIFAGACAGLLLRFPRAFILWRSRPDRALSRRGGTGPDEGHGICR